tara:strand:- start:50 stop:337 length:288 start_codon:yes stop_codon:yes gene_type:complete
MKKLTSIFALTAIFTLPIFAADMNFTPKADISFSGKIATVKTSKKFRSVESCQALCTSRSSCVAFTLDTSKGSCTILKTVTRETVNNNAVSGLKN